MFTLDLTKTLGDKNITNILAYSATRNSLNINYAQTNTSEITVESQTIAAYKGIRIETTLGNINEEYLVSLTLEVDTTSSLEVEFIVVSTNLDFNYYGSAYYADDYFALKLNSDTWSNATIQQKIQALRTATLAIDRLNYTESKTNATQSLEFPRDSETSVPADIVNACYEEAISLLSGADPQLDQTNLGVVSEGFSSVRTTYERTFVQESVRAGITSQLAWGFLRPYLRDPNEITLCRV